MVLDGVDHLWGRGAKSIKREKLEREADRRGIGRVWGPKAGAHRAVESAHFVPFGVAGRAANWRGGVAEGLSNIRATNGDFVCRRGWEKFATRWRSCRMDKNIGRAEVGAGYQ